jgi:signal transduction histidine kinase
MKGSLKVKLTAIISLLVLVVVLAVSALYLLNFVRRTLEEVERVSGYIRMETFSRARLAVAATKIPAYVDPADFNEVRSFIQVRLSQDDGLRSLMESAVSYYPSIEYVALTGPDRIVLADNNPDAIGKKLPRVPRFLTLLHAGFIHQLHLIYGPPQTYEIDLPLEMSNRPFGDVCVGVSNVFLAAEVTPRLKAALELAAIVVVLATLSAGLLSLGVLRPLATISQGLDRITRGEFTEPVRINRVDEWGVLSSKLNLLGEQIRGDKAAYLALKENMDQLIGNLVDGLMLFDSQDRLVLVTPSTRRFLLRPTEELIHRTAQEVFSGNSSLDVLLRSAFENRQSLRGRAVDLPEAAEASQVSVTSHVVQESGHQMATLVTLRDAGTRAQLEDQIGVTTKLAALGRLTSGVAHEVKNPLNAMIIQVEILKAKLLNQGGEVKPQLEILSQEIRRLDRVVKTFLDFTRPLEINRSETSVTDLVREVFALAEPQAQKYKVQLVLQQNGEFPPMRVDQDLIKQALLNLVLNGCQAMPQGGELRVRPRVGPKSVELEISDQGVGIPEDARSRIFSLYYTTKPNGTGVGLAMAFRIIQLHNGSIDFSSEVNRGTTFRVSLPL